MLGLARRAGKAEVGEEAVGKASRAGKMFLILLARDASDNTGKRAESFGRIADAPVLRLEEDKARLGKSIGLDGPAMVGITDPGMASAMAEKLRGLDGGEEAAGILSARAALEKSRRPARSQVGRRRQG